MNKRHKKKSNLKKIRSWFAKNLSTKKRRRRSRKKRKVNLWENLKDIYVLNFKPKKNRRRRRKRSLHKRIFLHGNRFIQNTIAYIGKLFSKKRKRRRKRKQYAVYVMSNQKKVD